MKSKVPPSNEAILSAASAALVGDGAPALSLSGDALVLTYASESFGPRCSPDHDAVLEIVGDRRGNVSQHDEQSATVVTYSMKPLAI